MDSFIKRKDFKKAALTAHEVLLQENSENELTLAASLYSCMKHIAELRSNNQELESESSEENKKNEEEEKLKLLVYFMRKPYNDEHFDLKNERLLCGKTIYFASRHAKTLDTNLANNLKVLFWSLFYFVSYSIYSKKIIFIGLRIVALQKIRQSDGFARDVFEQR
jgi:small subunit ribosomal protein S27